MSENSIWLRAACFLSRSTLLPQQGLHEGNRVVRLATSGYIDDETHIACFAVFARRKNARSRADDGAFWHSLANISERKMKVPMFGQALRYDLLGGADLCAAVEEEQVWVLSAMRSCGQELITLLWRILGNEQDVCDVYQSTFLRLAHFQGGHKPERVKAYVYRTATNTAISMLRSRASEHRRISDAPQQDRVAASPEQEISQKQLIAAMRSYIAQLPEHLRNVVTLRDLAELSYGQISKILGITAGTARVYRCKAIALLGVWMSTENGTTSK